jgi:beta-RFAP synthase
MPLADATQTEPTSAGSPGLRGSPAGTAVRVTAPARLHLGFLDLAGDLGRRFGSIGLAIDRPATELVVSHSKTLSATGPDSERALKALRRLVPMLAPGGTFRVDVASAIPSHAGLGSGTQLALAVGAALLALRGGERELPEIAAEMDRGARSAIGMAAFESGGFIVDGGRGTEDRPPPILMRIDFPEAWRVLLIIDPRATGVHGDAETQAFATLPPLPKDASAHVCRLVLMQLAPGLIEADIGAFGAAISDIQAIIGNHFAAAQGGSPWASQAVGRIAEQMKEAGAFGIGQSSWGPTGFAFTPTKELADRLYIFLSEAARAEGLEILVAKGRNGGACVDRIPGK